MEENYRFLCGKHPAASGSKIMKSLKWEQLKEEMVKHGSIKSAEQ